MGLGTALAVGLTAYSAKRGRDQAKNAAGEQAAAVGVAQEQLQTSSLEAAQLIAEGQRAAAEAVIQAGERAAQATLEAAALAREQIERFFQIAKTDIAEKLELSRGDINTNVDSAIGILEPFKQQGLVAGRELASMLGIANDRGKTVAFDSADLEATPQFQFQFSQGIKAIDRGSRKKLSGGQQKDLQTFGNGLASNVFNERISQLLGINSTGAQAAGGQASAELSRASLLSGANQSASHALATAAGGAGSQNAQISTNAGNSLASIAQNTGAGLANNATAGANALAGNVLQSGQDQANLSLGLGTIGANQGASNTNSLNSSLNSLALLSGSGAANRLFKTPLLTSGGGQSTFRGNPHF